MRLKSFLLFMLTAGACWAQCLSIAPASVTLTKGQSQQFEVTSGDNSVNWSIDNIGSITSTGLYAAPANVFANQTNTVHVTATSKANPSCRATATITLQPTVSISISPSSVTLTAGQPQKFTATVSGTTNTGYNCVAAPPNNGGSITGCTYIAPASITSNQTVSIVATSSADPTQSATATVTLTASSMVSIGLSPKTTTLNAGQAAQFTATVSGTTNTAVAWQVSPAGAGALTTNGLNATYTAPATLSSTQTVTIQVNSQADLTQSATATVTLAPATLTINVGDGAPNPTIAGLFITAYNRNGFSSLVSLPPLGLVKRLTGPSGAIGYVQEFPDANKTSGVKLALVKADNSLFTDAIYQITAGGLYAYYTSLGAATAGFPTMDSLACPGFDPVNTCTYDLFTNSYALFSYTVALATGQNFFVRNLFYTKWTALGGINGPGRPVDTEVPVTSSLATVATGQVYANGVIYSYTTGTRRGSVYPVVGSVYNLYLANGGYTGFLGLPVGDEMILSTGVHRQAFEGGSIDWNPGSDPTLRYPVAGVSLGTRTGPVSLNLGDTLQVTATVVGTNGALLTGRPVSWLTSNSRMVAIQANGPTATLTAVGAGSAQVTASSEGKSSSPINIQVASRCCAIGEGAAPAIQQAFQDAVTRNRLSVVAPALAPAERVGNGYVQRLQSAAPGSNAIYLLAKGDSQAAAYVVTGDILVRYQLLGGPAGSLGYPAADANPAGRQLFESGALAGAPVFLVTGALLAKWAVLGYETGPAGPPTADSSPFTTFGANSGDMQTFATGLIVAAAAGPRSKQSYFVSGAILASYDALGGPSGSYGMPVSEEVATGAIRRQNFEGGYLDYATGDASAQAHASQRQPAVIAAPASVVAGSRVRLAISGFADGSTVRVSISGQSGFVVPLANGAYMWDTLIPLSAPGGTTVTVQAVDTAGATAQGSYTILGFREAQVHLVKVQGDLQKGPPGARLPRSLRVALQDQSGNPLVGAPVDFLASSGQADPASAVTDANGRAETWLRLPQSAGVVGVRVDSPSIASAPITFGATAEASTLQNFPKLSQALDAPLGNGAARIADKGALLAAAASILLYHQKRGELAAPNGLADVAPLNQFLKNLCAVDANGARVCDGFLSNPDAGEQVVNLWRAGEFAGGGVDVSVEQPAASAVRDLLAQGSPVLLALALTSDGAPAGGHYVVAVGVSDTGSLLVQDPSPVYARTTLEDYLGGFNASGHSWQGTLVSAVRLVPRAPAPRRFLLAAISQPPALLRVLSLDVNSPVGRSASALDLPDPAATSVSRMVACDGSQAVYQLGIGASQAYRVTLTDFLAGGGARDLSGSAPLVYRATRPQALLVLAPQDLTVAAGGVVNAATFDTNIAPGELIAILGNGLAAPGVDTVVEIGGRPATLVLATPFQLTVQVPPDVGAGQAGLHIRSAVGETSQFINIVPVAPAIFMVAPGQAAVLNTDYTLNSPATPLARGQALVVYATGLGTVSGQGQYWVADEPVTAVLNGQTLITEFAGLVPGFIGLYQVNVPVPATTPPGLQLPLKLRQALSDSNVVSVAVQ